MKLSSYITFELDGLHSWPDAPPDVAYLKYPHRHRFHIAVSFSQPHPRAVEFHVFTVFCKSLLEVQYMLIPQTDLLNFGHLSCEEIATKLLSDISGSALYNKLTGVSVTVSEDGIAGSTASYG